MLFATAGLVLVACASSAQAGTPAQLSSVDETCSRVMGLRPGESYFAACRESLSQFLAADPVAAEPVAITSPGKSFYEVPPSLRWNRERQACVQMGLAPDSIAFSHCVTGLDNAFLPSPN
jgi:hypothetical protein